MSVRVVLCRPSHPGNIGAAARALMVMGLDELALVAPIRFPDDEATAMATTAAEVLERARVVATLDEAVSDCAWVLGLSARGRHEGPRPVDVAEAAVEAVKRSAAGPVALVFGNERAGLTNEELLRCHAVARIPTGSSMASLNLGQAVQVACYEVLRARERAGEDVEGALDGGPPASRGQIDAFVQRLWQFAEGLERVPHQDPRILRMRGRLRRLIDRAEPTAAELNAAHGMLTWVWESKEGQARGQDRDPSA